jgi:hypothetical protein
MGMCGIRVLAAITIISLSRIIHIRIFEVILNSFTAIGAAMGVRALIRLGAVS